MEGSFRVTRPIMTLFMAAPLAVLFGGLLLTAGRAADAACSCRCVNGSMQAICSSSLDIPPICPATLCGITPPAVRPISPPVIPPIGTQNCRKEQVKNPYSGRYEWRTLCRWRIARKKDDRLSIFHVSAAALFGLLLAGCSTPVTILKNEKTGQVARCGGGMGGSMMFGAIGYAIESSNDTECVNQYIKQGFSVEEVKKWFLIMTAKARVICSNLLPLRRKKT